VGKPLYRQWHRKDRERKTAKYESRGIIEKSNIQSEDLVFYNRREHQPKKNNRDKKNDEKSQNDEQISIYRDSKERIDNPNNKEQNEQPRDQVCKCFAITAP